MPPKSIFDKDVPPEEMIQGLLKMMPVGARTVTILPPEAVEEMAKDGENDPAKMKGVVTISDGPYLDDWSKVPPEIAAKYNTAPK